MGSDDDGDFPLVDTSGMVSRMPEGSWSWQDHAGPSGATEVAWLNPPGCKPSHLVYCFDLDGQ